MVGGGEHKVVLIMRGSRVYYVEMDWGLNFLYVYTLRRLNP